MTLELITQMRVHIVQKISVLLVKHKATEATPRLQFFVDFFLKRVALWL